MARPPTISGAWTWHSPEAVAASRRHKRTPSLARTATSAPDWSMAYSVEPEATTCPRNGMLGSVGEASVVQRAARFVPLPAVSKARSFPSPNTS